AGEEYQRERRQPDAGQAGGGEQLRRGEWRKREQAEREPSAPVVLLEGGLRRLEIVSRLFRHPFAQEPKAVRETVAAERRRHRSGHDDSRQGKLAVEPVED